MKYKNLTIIGTSHIACESIKEVENTIEEEKPDIVALELDRRRLITLLHPDQAKIRLRDIRHIGLKGYLFLLIGAWAERKLGKIVGVKPGSEMLAAVKLAKKNSIPVALIDQDIRLTLKRLSAGISWRERWHFFADIIKGIFLRKQEIPFDLTTVPNSRIIKKLSIQLKMRYPNVYRVLVDERNERMAASLASLIESNPDKSIVAIIGAGHEREIIRIIEKKLSCQIVYT